MTRANFPMDQLLLHWGKNKRATPWTLEHASSGTLILGATGSGKTSTTCKAIARAFLSKGYGGLVLVAKPEETADWQAHAKATGRENDLLLFNLENGSSFNFLEWEQNRSSQGGGLTINIVNIFRETVEIYHRRSGDSKGDSQFWIDAAMDLMHNAVSLLQLAGERITLDKIHRLLISIPDKPVASSEDPPDITKPQPAREGYCLELIDRARDLGAAVSLPAAYFEKQFPGYPAGTKGSVSFTLSQLISTLLREPLSTLFSQPESNITPDLLCQGKVIVVDLPCVGEYGQLGNYAAVLWKYLAQQAIQHHPFNRGERVPVFLFADECQYFLTEGDSAFLSTSRSLGCLSVFATQSLPALMRSIPSAERADEFLANLQTKFFHQNTCPKTNQWASSLFGDHLDTRQDRSYPAGEGMALSVLRSLSDQGASHSQESISERTEWQPLIRPEAFCDLRRGGTSHNCIADAIMHQAGTRFGPHSQPWQLLTYDQRRPSPCIHASWPRLTA